MGLLESFIRNPVKVSVGVLLVVLFGFISLGRMPIQLTPEVQIPTLTIMTLWPGASPQEVERQIVQEQEEQLKGVEGMRKMTSESADSSGTLTLEFDVGTDMNEALVRVNTRLQQVREYPEEADEPVISTSNSSDRPIAWFILRPRVPGPDAVAELQKQHPELAEALEPVRKAHNSGLRVQRLKILMAERPELQPVLQPLLPPTNIDVTGMRRFAEDFIEAEFERVPGVSQANVLGGREEEMQVIVDPERLAARQLTIADVRNALRGENVDTSGGDLWEGKRRWVVRTLGQFRSPEQVENALLARRDGSPVYVRDVGEVQLGYKKPDGLVRNFGLDGLAINAMRAPCANVLDVMQRIGEANQKLNDGILKQRGLQLEQVYDETEYIHSAIGLVQDNIVVGGILTVIVLLVFLRSGRSTLVISLAIPTSIIGTFLLMDLMGRSLNVISLAGLAFAVGMLVDNSIVVLENIFRRYQLGEDAMTASVRGAQEVWGAVVASTLTTLAVFLPVLFVQEEAGQLFRDIALAVSAGVGLSLIVSITVIPVATSRILKRSEAGQEHWGVKLLRPLDKIAYGFVRVVVGINERLQRSLPLQVLTVISMIILSIVLTWALIPGREYLPNGNRNLVIGILLPPPGYNIDRLTEMGEQLEARLKPYWNVDPDSPEASALPFPAIGDYFYVARNQQVFFGLRAQDPLRAGELVALVRQMASIEPGTFAAVFQSSLFEGGLTAGRTVDVEITGPDLKKLVALGGRILGQVTQQVLKDPQTQAIPKPSLDLSSPELHVVPKWEQAADMGITAADLGYTVNALVDGAKATDYYLGGDKIDLSIVGDTELARRTQDLEQLSIATPAGDLVSLGSVAKIDYGSGPEKISHRESQRAITIAVTPPPAVPVQDAVDRIQREIIDPLVQSGELGGEYQITLSGTADKLQQTWRALSFNVVLALLITYLLMAALFESWLYPLVIILSVPWGAVGGFLGLAILNLASVTLGGKYEPLDVLAMLGFVILIGTVVNNPILIVHQSLNHMREDGMPRDAAVIESVRNRIRPIFMTTATTVLGLLPLVLFVGAGSELYRGLGAVLLGGLLVSTLFTLVFVPTLFTLTLEARTWVLRQIGWSPAAAAETINHTPPLESAPGPEHRNSVAETNGNSSHHAGIDPQSSSAVPPSRELS